VTREQEPAPEAAQPQPPPLRPQVPDLEPPVIGEQSQDDQDVGWGESSAERSDEWYLSERPPHW